MADAPACAVEARDEAAAAFAALLSQRVGVQMQVELVAPGATAPLTQVDSRQKPLRLIDERPKNAPA